jgi:hypothetical protein
MTDMDEATKQNYRDKIDEMSQEEMARLWRFAPPGHPIFDTRNGLDKYFNERFKELGGWTPEISKKLG